MAAETEFELEYLYIENIIEEEVEYLQDNKTQEHSDESSDRGIIVIDIIK